MRSADPVREPARPAGLPSARRRSSQLRRALVLGGAALACAGCGELHSGGGASAPARQLTVALDGAPSALYAPLYAGLADGAFGRGALNVNLVAESSDSGSLAALAAGQAQVAIASEPAVLAARAGGARIVAIGALEDGPLEAVISLQGPAGPRALIGKRVVTDGTPLASAELNSYLASASVPRSRLTVSQGGAQALLAHRAYAMLGRWDLDGVSLALAHRHVTIVRSLGVPTYTDLAIVVRVGEARYGGALLRAFLQSLSRAEAATRADPTAAARALVAANPALTMKLQLAELVATQTAAEPALAGKPYGYQNPPSWQAFGNWMAGHGLLRSAAVAGDTVTDEFLPGQGE